MKRGFDFYDGSGPGPPETREEFICHARPFPYEPDSDEWFDLTTGRAPIKDGQYLELTQKRAENLLWEALREAGMYDVSRTKIGLEFDMLKKAPLPPNSVTDLLWAAFRNIVMNTTDQPRIRTLLLQKLANYGVKQESFPGICIIGYTQICSDIMRRIGLHGYWYNAKPIAAALEELRERNPNQRWSTLLWDVFRKLCPTPAKTSEAWGLWLERIKNYAEEPHPNPIPLTRDLALEVCIGVLKEARIYPPRNDVHYALFRRMETQIGVYWKVVMAEVVCQFCPTDEQRGTALNALTRRFYESHNPNQVVERVYPGCAAVRNGTQKWLDEALKTGKSQVTEMANSIVLEALRRCRTISSLDEWEKASLVDTLGKQQPAVVERVLWDLAQHLVNAKQVPAAGLIHQLSMRTDLTPADMVYQAVKVTVEYLPKFTVDDLLNLTKGPSRRDIESFLQDTMNPVPSERKMAPRGEVPTPAKSFQSVQVDFIFLDESEILRVKNLTEGSANFQQNMSGITITSTGVQSAGVVPVVATTTNPLIAAMQQRNRSKEMTATQLLNQTSDKELKRLVTGLYLCLAKDNAWRTFAEYKGATSGASAEAHIQRAIKTGEPERFVIADIANYPGYLATEFLNDLSSIHVKAVTMASEQIMAYLTSQERETQTKFEATGRLNGQLRAWLETNRLCPPDEVQARLDSLLAFGVQHLDDMALMTEKSFKNCGFTNLYPAKCVNALPTLMAQVSCTRPK